MSVNFTILAIIVLIVFILVISIIYCWKARKELRQIELETFTGNSEMSSRITMAMRSADINIWISFFALAFAVFLFILTMIRSKRWEPATYAVAAILFMVCGVVVFLNVWSYNTISQYLDSGTEMEFLEQAGEYLQKASRITFWTMIAIILIIIIGAIVKAWKKDGKVSPK